VDIWVTNMTHFLDADGNVSKQLSFRRLMQYLGTIVAAVTTQPSQSSHELDIKCRRRPGRKSFPGMMRADFDAGTANIILVVRFVETAVLSTIGKGRRPGTRESDPSCPKSTE